MALTVKLRDNEGNLSILDDEIGVVGNGKAQPSKNEPGYITLLLNLVYPMLNSHTGEIKFQNTLVLRVPINWLEYDNIDK